MEILETTTEEQRAAGQRVFEVNEVEPMTGRAESGVTLRVEVGAYEDRAIGDEVIDWRPSGAVTTNQRVAVAMVQLASRLLKQAGALLANPND